MLRWNPTPLPPDQVGASNTSTDTTKRVQRKYQPAETLPLPTPQERKGELGGKKTTGGEREGTRW